MPNAAFALDDLGWMHPAGPHCVASMFRDERTQTIYGVSQQNHNGALTYEWLERHADGSTAVSTLPFGDAPQFPRPALLYGSMARDSKKRVYVVGSMGYKPLILQVTPAN